MNKTQDAHELYGKPHGVEILNPFLILPIPCASVYLCFELACGRFSTVKFIVTGVSAVILTAAVLLISAKRHSACEWHIDNNVLHYSRGIADKRNLTLRLDRVSYSEICDNPVYSLFGGTRVRLYSSVSAHAVFSMILPKAQAAELINRTAVTFGAMEAVKPRRMVHKKYSALLAGVTSRGTFIPLGISAIFCIFGHGSIEMHIIAAAFWLFAALNVFVHVLSECRMSVCRVNMGYAVQKGFFGGHRVFVPDRAIVGIIETCSPIAAFSGAGRFELLCAGGKKITCLQWYDGGHAGETARRILDCSGRGCTEISDLGAVRQRYIKSVAADIIGIIVTWVISMLIPDSWQSLWISASAAVISGIMIHCLTAVKCGADFGMSISGSSMRIGGMGILSAEYLTLRRGKFAAVKIRQNLFERMSGKCTAEFIPKGSRRSVKCRCVPYDRIIAVVERFY